MNQTLLTLLLLLSNAAPEKPFRIDVVDEQTGRGVPLVELETTNNIRFVTDSAGMVAFDEPGFFGQEVFFHVRSHGYEFPKDGFGIQGRKLRVEAGGQATLKVKRINIAERLYRVTGAGIYRDSVLLGEQPPIKEPLLNAQVTGSDSVVNAVYRGRIYWFWGDTNRPAYPLGNFHVPGATSLLPQDGGLPPDRGVDLHYFVGESGFAKETCRMPGDGPTWIFGLVVVPDATGRERLLAHYVKVKPPLSVYAQGLCEFDDDAEQFRQKVTLPLDAPLVPGGQPFLLSERGGKQTSSEPDFVLFATPYALVRVKATAEAYADLSQYEAWTYLKPGSKADAPEIERDANGRIVLGWKRGALPLDRTRERMLLKSGALKPDEAFFVLKDADSGKAVTPHAGSIHWNPHRQRWAMIFCEHFGTSLLGEIWYAEAGEPTGPWLKATKIITHDKYSFYNPKHHHMLDQEGGRFLYFEGTYTHTFSGNAEQTPRYDYNQIMYRLDLDDPRLTGARVGIGR